jgi:phosphoglycolate phosphatase-like HAD superfamily hydrolase
MNSRLPPGRISCTGDAHDDARQARKAGVIPAVVQTGGQVVQHLHKIQAESPHHLLASFAGLRALA